MNNLTSSVDSKMLDDQNGHHMALRTHKMIHSIFYQVGAKAYKWEKIEAKNLDFPSKVNPTLLFLIHPCSSREPQSINKSKSYDRKGWPGLFSFIFFGCKENLEVEWFNYRKRYNSF